MSSNDNKYYSSLNHIAGYDNNNLDKQLKYNDFLKIE